MKMIPNKRQLSNDVRQRRAHEKSRNGCLRCKRLRKKCDENHPKCLRCAKQNMDCQYSGSDAAADLTASSIQGQAPPAAARDSDMEMMDSSPSGYSPVRFGADTGRSPRGDGDVSIRPSNAFQKLPLLNSHELDLLSHYISHTSRVIPPDKDDLFALRVGMPNLAFTSAAVMGSIIALSAACKCKDMLASSASLEKLDEMRDLLNLADSHHQSSLDQLQQDINEKCFQSVLANAALMVLYALSDHCVRVLLARRAMRNGATLSSDMRPSQSQWITSIRAAHVAFVGLQQPGLGPTRPVTLSASDLATDPYPSPSNVPSPDEDTYFSEDGPAEETRRLLLPLVTATYQNALTRLRARNESPDSQLAQDPKFGACEAAITLLEELCETILGSGPQDTGRSPDLSMGMFDNVPTWLVKYLARVTSASPSKMWRRTTMSYLNRVPIEFLHLVQSALDCMPVDESQTGPHIATEALPLEAAHKPAMDIFAHWLVLVMLLDGVWWIGDIGYWELGRILRFMDSHGFALELESGETWWPETMHAIKSTLTTAK